MNSISDRGRSASWNNPQGSHCGRVQFIRWGCPLYYCGILVSRSAIGLGLFLLIVAHQNCPEADPMIYELMPYRTNRPWSIFKFAVYSAAMSTRNFLQKRHSQYAPQNCRHQKHLALPAEITLSCPSLMKVRECIRFHCIGGVIPRHLLQESPCRESWMHRSYSTVSESNGCNRTAGRCGCSSLLYGLFKRSRDVSCRKQEDRAQP